MLRASAERGRTRPALRHGDLEIAYGELDDAADALARRLSDLGIGRGGTPGSRVVVLAPNVPALVVGLFAAWRAGAVAVPLSARLREHELTGVLVDARVAAFVSVRSHQGYSFADLLTELAPRLPLLRGGLFVDDLGEVTAELPGHPLASEDESLPGMAALLYTSGTTGTPKGALVAHAPWVGSAHEAAALLGCGPEDAAVHVVPIAHAFGLVCLLATIASGSRAVLVNSTFTLDPVLRAIEESEASVIHGSPTLFAGLLKVRPRGVSSLQRGFVAGAPCPPALIERLEDTGTCILNLYGMTEIGAASACRGDDPPETRRETVGRPFTGFEFRVMPVQGAEPPAGELQVRGPTVTPGYYRQPEQTAAAFDGEWFRTGDIGTIDPGGEVRVLGRAKELVQVGGFNVFPAEVEQVLLSHPGVSHAAVVPVARDDLGEGFAAFVVARPGAELSPAMLLRFARTKIAGYKLPYRIEVLEELPLLASGKPDRRALAQALVTGARS